LSHLSPLRIQDDNACPFPTEPHGSNLMEKKAMMTKNKDKWDTLDGILNEVWNMLKRGATRSNDPFHWPVLGTSGKKGCSLRTVILRQFLLPERLLVCYTDARSEKVKEIKDFSQTSWLFYHPKRKVQLRITGPTTLHGHDRYADEIWSAIPISHRFNYGAKEPPGTSIEHPSSVSPEFFSDKARMIMNSDIGREHFMVIRCRMDELDWLRLSPLGNRRARFDWDEMDMKSTWMEP